MTRLLSFRCCPGRFLLTFAGLCGLPLMAAPTAVNDSYSTAEDTVLNVSAAGGGSFLSDAFAANISGWTYANNIFGGNNSGGTNSGSWSGTVGNPAGGLTMVRAFSGFAQGTRNAGFSKTFTLGTAQAVRVTFDAQVTLSGVGGGGYGAVIARVGTSGATTELGRQTGNGTLGWQTFTYTTGSLAAGTQTLQIGIFCANSGGGSSAVNFDNVKVESLSGGSSGVLANDTGGVAPVTAAKLTDPANGAVTLNADGSFTYTPNANFSGTDSFTYRASDSTGDSGPATVTINVTPVNDAPVAVNDAYSTNEDTTLNISAPGLISNDTDADGNPLTAAVRSQPGNGTVTVNANGSFTYTPNANYSGADTFSYRVNDGTTNSNDATVTITVNAVNDPPTGVADGYFTTVNTPLNVTLTTPVGQPTTTVMLVAPGSTVPSGDPAEADLPVWRFLDNGTDQGTAWRNPGFDDSAWGTGKAELGYGDDADGRPERTVVQFGPDSGNKYATTYFRTTFQVVDKNSLSGLAMLLMRDDAAAVYLNGTEIYRDQTANGFPGLNANPAFNAYAGGNISNADEAALRDLTTFMTANAAQFLVEGTNVLAVEVHQANGTSSDLSMDIQLTAQRGPYAGVLYNDSDVEGSALTAALVTAPASGSLTLNANGTFSYTPAPGFIGTASFVYRANDGSLNSANTTVTITVASAGNVPPLASNDAYSTNEDVPLNIAAPGLLANDSDPENGALTAQQLTGPANGTLTLNTDGSFLYTPAANFNGSDSFTYRARDPLNASSAAATVSLTVNPVNDAPVAVADTYGTDVGVTLVVPAASGLLANDSDAEGSALTAQLVSGPASGSLVLNPNGSFTYAPPAGFAGQRTFTYRASDGTANSNTVTVTINVLGAPTANANSYTTAEDTPLTISAPGVLGNDTDPQSLPLTAVNATQPANGSVTLNTNGSFIFTPTANFAGSTSFTYQASNGSRISAPATVSLTVTAVNDAPVAANDSYNGMPGQTLIIASAQGVFANDSDAENSPLTLTQLSDPLNGVLSLASDGSFSYVPNTGFTGSDSFTYKVSDGTLESAAATVTLTIAQPGDDIIINEIMYRPGTAYPENTALEWIELLNRGTTPVDLTGWTISSGVTYAFPAGRIMAPGSYLVVAANVAAFQAAYPGVTNVIGGWTGALSGGEKIQLTDAQLNDYDKVSYADEGDWATRDFNTTAGWFWTTLSNGGNRTLALRNPALSNDNGQAWTVSQTSGGTPGSANDVLTANIPPIIKAVKHEPAVPTSTDRVRISCELNDESSFSALTATLFWRVSVGSPGAFQQLPMSQDGKGGWFAKLEPQANNTIVEFYISASDGVNTRTWPAVTTQGQTANCLYQVSNEAVSATAETVRLVLTSADNTTFTGLSRSGERQFNHTLVVVRGQETSVRYRSSMRMRGNSSKSYALHAPLRITIPDDDDLGGETGFNLHPKAPHIQHLGMRMMLASGIQASHTHPVEFRRNGVEYTTSSGSTPDFGMWARVEGENGDFVSNHWPNADTGGFYTKRSPERYWRSSGWTVPSTPTGLLDDWTKQNNANANDWTDLTSFFSITQSTAAAHFPGASATDVSQSNGGRLSGTGAWDFTAMTGTEFTQLNTVADTDQWARFFAAMTILMDYETNVSNGVDDDYGIYFLPSAGGQRRAQFVPHDLDTIFGLGDTQPAFNAVGLYDMTEGGGSNYAFRTLLPLVGTTANPGHAGWRTTYHNALRELLGTVFNTDNGAFQQSVDYHLAGWVPAGTRDTIKTFAANRRAYLLGLLGGSATVPPPGTSNATFTSAHGTLFISEILANNVAAHNNSATFPDVIELHNTGAAAVNLTGYSLTDDPLLKAKFVFPAGSTIAAGARLVIYADTAATPGTHTGFGLDNDGGVVQFYTPVTAGQALVDSIAYGLQAPDLSIGRTGAALDVWTLCTPTIGTANTAVATFADPAGLRINEFLGNADYRAANDFIELYNPAATPVALGGMSLTDDFVNYPQRHLIPPLSFMSAGQFVAFEAKGSAATPGNARELPFNIGSSTGGVALLGANGSPVDKGDTLPQFRDVSIGRSPDGTGAFTALNPPSPGSTNAPLPDTALELLAFLRITEMMYNPASSTQSEYIEFRNLSDTLTLDLSGVSFKNGITFTFPPGSTLAPGAFLVIVENSARFTAQFPAVPVGGVYTGRLDNGGERVRFDIPGYNIAILDFTYDDAWYPSTDGGGDAMQIVSATASPAMWDRSEGWQASTPNPGSVPPFGVYAGVDLTAPVGVPVFLDGALNNGSFTASSISVLWSRDSGPAAATFTTAACDDANAIFTTPGVYVLRLTATAPGPVTATDLVTVTVYETYASWAATALAGQSAANQLPGADPDGDGVSNAAEWALNGSPLNAAVTGQPVPAPHDGLLAFTWTRNLLADPAVQTIPQLSEDLVLWQEGPAVLDTVSTGSTATTRTWLSTETGFPGFRSRAYMRVLVIVP